ncbi:hypothetical protein BV898_14993 [Hypsibius exemplaris]|uniref:Uncharacterized protein n=1 Tax=Hypsibius exemplaris TaxID=2072580 RepID=A0A9X6RJZ9_HYPEX|nr:hypothetical protein BV898_14993 [Hypsibius exemplaris]
MAPISITPAVDILMSSMAIESASPNAAAYADALKRMTDRYLKPGGAVVLNVALKQTSWKMGNDSYHTAFITAGQVKEALINAGFGEMEMWLYAFEEVPRKLVRKLGKQQSVRTADNKLIKSIIPFVNSGCDCDSLVGIALVKGIKLLV